MRNTLISMAVLVSSAAFGRSEDRTVPAFTAVHISAGMRATVEIGPQRPVHLEADDALLPLIETVVEDGALQVRYKQHTIFHHGERQVRITIQTPELHAVGASGGSIVKAALTRTSKSEIQASGGSEISVRGVDAGRLDVQGSGGSVVEVSGSADALSLQLSGGSQLHGRDFSTRDLDVQGSGGSQAELKATGKIRGGLSGGSQLHASGGASARVSTSGGSQVSTD
jgi:hypothetical protein